jgi:hypothetical protein
MRVNLTASATTAVCLVLCGAAFSQQAGIAFAAAGSAPNAAPFMALLHQGDLLGRLGRSQLAENNDYDASPTESALSDGTGTAQSAPASTSHGASDAAGDAPIEGTVTPRNPNIGVGGVEWRRNDHPTNRTAPAGRGGAGSSSRGSDGGSESGGSSGG